MDKTKQTLAAAVLAMLVVAAGSWFFLISPQRSQVASLNSQTQQVVTQNTTLETQISQLKAESVQVSGAQATLAAIARRLPPDPQEANLITDLQHAADAANVDLQIITPLAPVAVAAPAAAVTAAPTTSAGATSTATAGTATAGTATAPARAPASSTQLYQIPITLTVAGNYFDVEMFVHSVEGMQRAMVIDQLGLTNNTSSGAAGAVAGTSASPGATATSGTSTSTGTTKAGSTATGKTGKTGKTGSSVKAAKPVPGSPAGAEAELNSRPYVADAHTLTVTITGKVFAMYSPAAAAAVAAASAPTAAATPAPAPTK